jgi:hypothetical protein
MLDAHMFLVPSIHINIWRQGAVRYVDVCVCDGEKESETINEAEFGINTGTTKEALSALVR